MTFNFSVQKHKGLLQCCLHDRFGNVIERLVGSGSSSLVTPLQTLPSQSIGKVYNPFAVSILDSHLASMRSKEISNGLYY